MRPSPSGPDPLDVLADPDPVGAFLRAHTLGRRVALRTSGSSDRPRRVVRTTRSWTDSFDAVACLAGLDAASRIWVPGPSSGTMNLFARVHATVLGAALVADPADATHAVLTPRALGSLVATGARPPEHLVVAGDRLEPALQERASELGSAVHHYYGAAELSFVAWGSHADDLRPFPGVDVLVRDGVVWVDSPFVAERYDDADLRRDGSYVTAGDRGELRDGVLRVLGRDDVVVTGGATVRVADVEAALGGGVVVLGLPHESWGAVVAAVVPTGADVRDLRARARRTLDTASRPRAWFRLDELPVGDAGKTDRRALAAAVAAGRVPRCEPGA